MSKRLDRKLKKLFQLVCRGLDMVKKPISVKERKECLMSIQESVILIGTKVEKVVPDSEMLVEQLSKLAEYIYQLSLGEEMENHIWRDTYALCDTIKDEIKQVLQEKYEILFLPYKVSMWDSFASVYEAAVNNKECVVRVMPVPYYSVSEDRTGMEMKYEGDQFRNQVTVTDYREYSIEESLPDVIFIHNPYDDTNFVTSLPEKYFSRELKKYTEHLVYIPYKVCSGDVKDTYCMMPGVTNAWRVFVMSERVRNTYIKYQDRNKIIATGSPKIDAVIQYEKNPPKMPNEWQQVLKERKVFLLNTHLNSLINQGEKAIQEIRHLISIFEERPQAAILWRPHPLSIETIKSMNPAILEEYCKLIHEFCELKNSVYDESGDPHMAIALADAYIGDWSSMVTMFGVTGKPIYVRNITFPKEKHKNIDISTQSGMTQLLEDVKKQRIKTVYLEKKIEPETYIDSILNGRDPLAKERKNEFQNIVCDIDGQAGIHIWNDVWTSITLENE